MLQAQAYYSGSVIHVRSQPRLNSFKYNYAMVLYKIIINKDINSSSSNRCSSKHYRAMIKMLEASDYKTKDFYHECDIYWLAEPGMLGYRFNPISFWYFISPSSAGREERIKSILATVSNTPWGEEILYDLPINNSVKLWKRMHVSPFNPPRDQYYLFNSNHECNQVCSRDFEEPSIDWRLTLYNKDESLVLSADMRLKRAQTMPYFIAFNFILIAIRIYYQAFLMWLKKFPYHEHKPID